MRFLIITQDLRVSGTSQGIIERSFLAKLRKVYPNAIIDVLYLKHHVSDDDLDLLPIDSIETHVLALKIPFFTKWLNKIHWRIFNSSLNEAYVHKVYGSYIAKVDSNKYDHIIIRSSGTNCETILGSHNLPILNKSFITFNEPYPYFWCSGGKEKLSKFHYNRLKKMLIVIEQSKGCISTKYLGRDLQFLYGTRKLFYDIPHQFVDTVFETKSLNDVFSKRKKVTISYHGAIQFGRNLDEFLDVYCEIIKENDSLKENTEFFTRLKSSEYKRLKLKYSHISNIHILEGVDFYTSYHEQSVISDINVSLENGPIYCSVLLGKAPLLDFVKKRFLSISPLRSEMRENISNDKYIATYNNKDENKNNLTVLINEVIENKAFEDQIFGNYFSDESFKKALDNILN